MTYNVPLIIITFLNKWIFQRTKRRIRKLEKKKGKENKTEFILKLIPDLERCLLYPEDINRDTKSNVQHDEANLLYKLNQLLIWLEMVSIVTDL